MEWLIGDALIRWTMITQGELDSALALSKETALPLGKSLVALNAIGEDDLRKTVQLQSMLRDGILTAVEADRVMSLCHRKKLTLTRALLMTGLISLSGPRTRLGQLLIDCGCVNHEQLDRSLEISQRTGLPLGTVLVHSNVLDKRVLDMIVRFQKLLRRTNSPMHLETLKNEVAKVRAGSLPRSKDDTRLGSLLVAAAVISKSDLKVALDFAAVNQKMLGELLVEMLWITQSTLDAALELQRALREKLTDSQSAAELLQSVHRSESVLSEVASKRTGTFIRSLSFGKFLTMSGCIDEQELRTASSDFIQDMVGPSGQSQPAIKIITSENPFIVRDMVCKSNLAPLTTIKAAMRLWQSVRTGLLPLTKAIVFLGDHLVQEKAPVLSTCG